MANIQDKLNNIKNAVYGKDVRDSIHDAIEQCYNDAITNGNTNMEVILARGKYENLNERLNDHSSQIKEKVNKGEGGVITNAMLSQEIKEAMTGGSVAVVGENAILTENIVDKQVTYNKTNFMELDTSLNLFDGNYLPIHIAGSISMHVTNDENSKTAIVKIKPNTVYSIIKNKAGRFNLGTATQIIEPSKNLSLDGSVQLPYGNSTKTYATITTGDNDEYLYVNVTDDNEDIFLQIVEGTQETLTVNYYPLKFTDNVMVYNKKEIDDKITDKYHVNFVKSNTDINLYTGLKLENRKISGDTSTGIRFESVTNSDVYIVPVEPNKTYSVLVKDTDLIYKDKKYIKVMTCKDLFASDYTGAVECLEYAQPVNGNINITLTTGADAHYMYLYLFTNDLAEKDRVFQVVEGIQKSLTIDNMDDCYEFTGVSCYPKHKLYTKDEINLLLEGISKPNIFNKNGEICNITLKDKVGYTLKHNTNSNINLDTWLLTEGTANNVVLWSGTDIEAPIKEKNTSDFIGGVHGDEVYESVNIICDGRLLDLNKDYNLTFSNLTIFVKSTLYRCETTTPVFTRYKKLEFVNSELIVSNRLICLVDNFLVERYTGCGLYSVYKDLLLGYTINTNPQLITSGGVKQNVNTDIGTFFGDGYTVTLKTLSGKTEKYIGTVADFSSESRPRYKLYFDCINSSSGYQLNTNNELNASFSIKID